MDRTGLPLLNHVLQYTLRSLCSETDWVYAVFWRILPRNYPPPKWETEGGMMDRSKGNKRNWILVWEDGFCNFPTWSSGRESKPPTRYGSHMFAGDNCADPASHPELFFKMSHEVYNYGEGLMGKIAADNTHRWVYREPVESEISFHSPWHSSLDPHPRTWESQFKSGIQTIAVIAVREGLIQLGSTRKVIEDLNFVILLQRKFNYLQCIPGVFGPHPFPHPNVKRRAREGNDTSAPPPEWMGRNDQVLYPLMNGLYSRSDSDSYLGRWTQGSKTYNGGIVGGKRPLDCDTPFHNTDFPVSVSPGNDFVDLSTRHVQLVCISAQNQLVQSSGPKQNPQCGNSISLLPSMSSLHNLLSKLPSVTIPETTVCPTAPLSLPSVHCESGSPSKLPDSPLVIAASESADQVSSPKCSSDDQCYRRADNTIGSNQLYDRGHEQEHWQTISNQEFSPSSSDLEYPASKHAGHTLHGHENCKLTSFLDSFDHLADLDLLESNETYNSFLSEIF